MSEFEEFDQQGSVPTKETGAIISHAFEMYKGVILYAVVAMLIYVIADSVLQSIIGFNSWSMVEEMKDSDGDISNFKYYHSPGLSLYYSFSSVWGALLSPLYIGLIFILNKYNTKSAVEFSDLFIGYRQNFLNIFIYSLITHVVLRIALAMCGIPFFFVFPLFLLGYPILLFENATAMDALKKSYEIAKDNYGTFLGVSFLGLILSFCGFLACCIGILVTGTYITAVMYSTYCAFLGKPRQIL
ncbi:beta-carotene 15,15'-monooxygenase [Chryseobacterium oryctis]|uniref:Beta-carotene 15,15'-monooxygenase n=1 Tax=Chryseobacterium oryctis TaxID=2952618 RepID=A0ABT3HMF2_9FLAO|nr:beta-carotene 15,15'-monooxygenase [Chryseobacterium oryctis]MCW3160798.1 beta-carotene 15,15'-monooxygenase [Chryseobacterium oryctis]